MVMLPRVIGDSVRAARLEAGLSQDKLARSCGLSRRHIVAIENHCNFTLAVLLALARGLPEFRI
jgi:DNA-binding XRE family transcriptional regulator